MHDAEKLVMFIVGLPFLVAAWLVGIVARAIYGGFMSAWKAEFWKGLND